MEDGALVDCVGKGGGVMMEATFGVFGIMLVILAIAMLVAILVSKEP